jgi:hypothetical protein
VLNSTITILTATKTSWDPSTDFETIRNSKEWEQWMQRFFNDYEIPETVFVEN